MSRTCFATLDPTTRKIDVPGAGNVVMTDTVGFVSALASRTGTSV